MNRRAGIPRGGDFIAEIRRYVERDATQVGVLIADTYGEFNLAEMAPGKRASMLGPFAFAYSSMPAHRTAISEAIAAPSVWVAERDGVVVGVLRGGRTDHRGRTVLSSLFVAAQHHDRGIGRALVERFEQEYTARGASVFSLSATVYAVPFYLSVGYKKTTGLRSAHSFGEPGLPYQPMKKVVENERWVGRSPLQYPRQTAVSPGSDPAVAYVGVDQHAQHRWADTCL